MFIVEKMFKEHPEGSMPNGSSIEHLFQYLFEARKLRGYNSLRTVRCFPLGIDNTDQSKDLVGNYIIFLETLDELVARDQLSLCYSLD